VAFAAVIFVQSRGIVVKNCLSAGLATALVLLSTVPAGAAEYHVAKNGNDSAAGSKDAPWQTMQKAATTLKSGDTCIVHAGTYREWVNPARGGTAAAPITYQAATGEDVYLKGSNQIDGWTQDAGQVWKVVVPNSTFGTFNPYSAKFTGDYLNAGQNYHLGNVYSNGKPYSEVLTQAEVGATAETWYAEVDGSNTTIWANFGATAPSAGTTEINVRKFAFSPSTVGLDYLVIRGFHISHGATNWAPPNVYPQEGLVMMNFGMGWLIENNYISDGKTICVSGGLATGNASQAIDQVGNHVIRHNTIERCGQAGIAGSHGMVASVIEGNLIQDIVTPTTHISGFEQAGIKIHSAIDVVIRGNVIRRAGSGALGIWLDWQAQGSRITGNVLDQVALEFEADHGPTLIDNNVFRGTTVVDVSEASVFVHNLFVDTTWGFGLTDSRTPDYFKPHTTQSVASVTHTAADNKYFNNIFVAGGGAAGIPQQPGFQSDYNVYYKSGGTTWGDAKSITKANFDAAFKLTTLDDGVTMTFAADSAPTDVQAPSITRAFIGLATLTQQGIENHDGTPITIDHDLKGAQRNATHPTAGPLESLGATNTVTLKVGAAIPPGTGGGGGGGTGGTGSGGAGTSVGGTHAGGGSAVGAAGKSDSGSAGAPVGAGGTGSVSSDGGATASTAGAPGSQGSAGKSNNAGTSASLDPEAPAADSDSGCSCGIPTRRSSSTALGTGLLAAAALLGVGRRRRYSR